MLDEQHINLLKKHANFEQSVPRKKSRWLFLLIAIIVLIVGGCSALAIISHRSDTLAYDPNTLEPKQPEGFFKKLSYLVFKKDINLEGEKMDRINILLLGMGGPGHDGPYLTDTIIIASIQPSTNHVALISIPRDLGVPLKDSGVYRINSANAYGETDKPGWGGAYATEVISETFGVDIPYYIRLDFTAFKEIIDEVGGVRIEVAKTFTDYQYPGPKDSYQTVSFKAGPQTMDGETALKYARSRHGNNGEGSDFARARRQQQILLALKEKVLSFATLTNPLRIKKIMDALEKNMSTNMQFDEIIELVSLGRELDTTNMQTLVLDDSPNGFLVNASTPGGAFILSPKKNSFDDISLAIENIFTSTSTPLTSIAPVQTAPEVVAEEPAIEIQNGTWSAGLAARVEAQLKEKQIYSDTIGNIDPDYKPIASSAIYVLNPKVESVAKQISEELDIPIKTTLPPHASPLATSTNIVVLLGDDFVE
ncbi:MAG: LCP family protein [Candidatus Magasanikbacteria bacterium]|nr:LCP family protein [Candidatus Magasanikbacteria bacterium]